jgi:hypothetical protein
VLDRERAQSLVESLDLDTLFACPCCLFDLAWRIYQGERLHWQTVAATTRLVWPEMAPTLEFAVIEARMREVHDAEDALRDLRELAERSNVARAAVFALAEQLATEIAGRQPRRPRR